MEMIVEKLCLKLKHSISEANDQIEWRNTAYCLS